MEYIISIIDKRIITPYNGYIKERINMNASLHLTKEMSNQTSTIGKVLMWMQDNEKQLRNTNCTVLGKSIALATGGNTDSIRMALQRMVNNQMIHRHGNKRRSRFVINYYHKDIPGYVIERAPQDIKDKIKAMNNNLASNQYIDKVGDIVTKPTKLEETKEAEVVKEEPAEPKQEAQKQNVVVPVEIKDDAKGLNLTITLNLTINR